MVCGSKSMYSEWNPEHIVVFNSNVCTLEDGKIWYGDIDITVDADKLTMLAKQLDRTVYVLYEMDARFDHEDKPLFNNAVFFHNADAGMPGTAMTEYVQICTRGKLKGRWVLRPECRR